MTCTSWVISDGLVIFSSSDLGVIHIVRANTYILLETMLALGLSYVFPLVDPLEQRVIFAASTSTHCGSLVASSLCRVVPWSDYAARAWNVFAVSAFLDDGLNFFCVCFFSCL